MKKLFLITASIVMFNIADIKAQVNYEHTYLTNTNTASFQEFFLTNIGNNNYKYVIYNYGYSTLSSFSLYNLDHTPYMLNIQIPLASDSINNIYWRLGYITTSLFDCDSTNIEYAMMLNSPVPSMHPNFCVYRTDGTLIFSKDTVGTVFSIGLGSGSYEMHPVMNTSTGAKLLLFNYNSSGSIQYTYIYGLCGTLPENIDEISYSDSYVSVFPNPSSNEINFNITPPSHAEEYELTIFNSAFQTVKTIKITGATYQITINSEYLNAGVYFYSLQNKNKVFQTGKINIIH